MISPVSYSFPESRRRTIQRFCKIQASGAYFPSRIVTNAEIASQSALTVTDTVIRKTIGVAERRVADPGVVDSDLLVAAAHACLAKAGLPVDDLSKILVTKFVGDRILPMTAAVVQRKLGAGKAIHSIDIDGGINAFLNALDLGVRYISTSRAREAYILILSGGLNCLPVSKTDPRLAFLFGDGAAAVLLAPADEQHFLASYSYTNPAYFEIARSRRLKIDAEISTRLYEQGEISLLYDLYEMANWKDMADFIVQAARVTAERLFQESGLSWRDIDLVLVTENNSRWRELILDSLQIPPEKSLSVIGQYGNTMSAMLPILIDKALRSGQLQAGARIMLISQGEGASGGGMIYQL